MRPEEEQAAVLKTRLMRELDRHPFHPAWWLRNPHAQTVWGPLVRKRRRMPMRRERWDTPDGDFLDLLFVDGKPGAPVVLLLHGLEATPASFYIHGLGRRFARLGWTQATLMFRSCGGEMNRARRLYHLGETGDAAWVFARLAERYPGVPFFAAGVSLGGNVLLKWLGETGADAPEALLGAAALSPPFDPLSGADALHRALGGFYVRHFLRTLIPKALAKAGQYPGALDEEALRNCPDLRVFDDIATARLHGFRDAEDYWRRSGSGQHVAGIRRPTLLVCAEDDPFMAAESLPRAAADASPWLCPQFTAEGGHVGFVAGGSPLTAAYWAEEQTVRFFQTLL
ncbi:MAG: alpha/beta hydrolase [Candidatus Hydrogenedentes bacterium]|nr:alpha/beta hydrolase [Candidatus Hydrogenedentota bacterium]